MDLVKRREILINLISRVGRGQQNVYRWVDELMEIDLQLEQQEQEKQETKTMSKAVTTSYQYIIKFSDSEDYISDKKLNNLAALWQGVVKDGDILTNIYPEDFCDDRTYFPVPASWDDYIPKYSEVVEAWEVPTPTEEEWQKAVQDSSFLNGKPYTKYLESTQPWVIVKFVPAHHEWRTDSPSYSRESSDGYRSGGSGGDRTKHYQVLIPDTWTWQSAAGTQAQTEDENTPPKVYNKYTYEWYVERIQTEYKDGYFARQRKWKADWKAKKSLEATKEVAQKVQKAAKLAEKPKDSKGKHPLASKKVCYPDLKKYFYSLYPELQEYEDYIQLSVGELSVAFECRIGTVTYEHELYGRELGDIYSFNENKKVDKIVTAQEEALSRAKKFKAFADAKAKEVLAKKEMLNLEAKKQKEYQEYKAFQKSKGGIVKPFEKWLQTVA